MGLRRPALPQPAVADVLRHRRLVADLRPHVPALRDAVRVRLDRQERQRLSLHRRDSRRGRRGRGRRVQRALRPARPAARRLRGGHRRLSRRGAAPLRHGVLELVGRAPAARDRAQLRLSRRHRHGRPRPRPAGRAARGRDRHPRSPLEDPLDDQLRPVLGHARARRDDRRGQGRGRSGPARTPAVVGREPQLGLDRGALGDEERGQGRRGAARGVRQRHRGRDRERARGIRRGPALHRDARRPLSRRVRAQVDLVARVHLPDLVRAAGADPAGRARLPRVRLRLPGRGQARQGGPRGRHGRGHGRRPARRGPRQAAGGARRLRRAQPAHARPSLLHRPGHERAAAPRARRDRAQAGRPGRARRSRGRVLPQVQRAAHAHRRWPRGRRRSRLAAPRRARGRVRAAPARLDRHGDGRSARVPVPHAVGLPREVRPPAQHLRRADHRPGRLARHRRGRRPRSCRRSTSSTRSRTARSSSAA